MYIERERENKRCKINGISNQSFDTCKQRSTLDYPIACRQRLQSASNTFHGLSHP